MEDTLWSQTMEACGVHYQGRNQGIQQVNVQINGFKVSNLKSSSLFCDIFCQYRSADNFIFHEGFGFCREGFLGQ